jgi:feruloyl esterase
MSAATMLGAGRGDATASQETPCAALAGLVLPDAVVTSAVLVGAQAPTPEYCRVLATVAPETDVEVRMPTAWTNRLLHVGDTALAGAIPNLAANAADLQGGYVLTASNGGHRDPTRGPTRFLDNPTLVEDFAHGAIVKTVRVAKALIEAYYGQAPSYSYFSGCSTGGREALNAAALYGAEYDGVIAVAPALDMPGVVSRWADAARLTPPSSAKLATLSQAQTAACDGLDGLVDGIIHHPAACSFDPVSLRCPANQDDASCLNDREIDVVRTLRTDLTRTSGKVVYPGFGIGNPGTGLGVFMPLAGPATPTIASFLAGSFLPFIVYNDPSYDPATYDLDDDFKTVVQVMEHTYHFSPKVNRLAQFLRDGKKVIIWHGAEDTLISHLGSIRAHEAMTARAGTDADNARLFVLPGVQHCGGGPGASRFDMLAALSDWVENGQAPGDLVASRTDAAGNVLFTRPICQFPSYPHYDGHGSPTDASSFQCVAPPHVQKQ